jgi:hypothetical protein
MRFGIPSAGMVGKQGVAATVSSRLVCQPCFICQLLHHCVNKRQPPIIQVGSFEGAPFGAIPVCMYVCKLSTQVTYTRYIHTTYPYTLVHVWVKIVSANANNSCCQP